MPLEQHPVPQQISSYQFRLVGDMTLKQFFQLAAGAGIGLLIYGLPLPALIKWPLIIFFVIAGAAFAFLPVQDRPLSKWLMAFFRSIYSPTIFTWQRGQAPAYFAAEETEAPSLADSPQGGKEDVQAQFGEIATNFLGNLEDAEEKYLSMITGLFKHGPQKAEPGTPAQDQSKPVVVNQIPPLVPQPSPLPPVAPLAMPTPMPPSVPPQAAPVFPTEEVYFRPVPKPPVVATAPKPLFQAPPVGAPTAPKPLFQDPATLVQIAGVPPTPAPVVAPIQIESPTQANILVGKVLDAMTSPIPNAIMEIKDEFGRPVRALKTDKDGRFRIVTPLHDGKYTIYTERDDYTFDPINLELQDTLVEPLTIEGRKI